MKKKIVIFSVNTGGGHVAASQAIEEALTDTYKIKVISLFKHVIPWIDPIALVSFGYLSLDDCYNFFIRKKCNRFANFVARIGVFAYPALSFFIKIMVERCIKKEMPDAIISVVPIVNSAIGYAAQKYKIPFIIVPTDLDTRWFTKYLQGSSYEKFTFTLSFDDPMIWEKLNCADIAKDQIVVTGFPIKKSFFDPKNIFAIKNEFALPKNKPVLMIMMGGIGSDKIFNYLKVLQKINFPLHILVCLGKHEYLKTKIKNLKFPPYVSISIIGFTDRIADLMAISDVCLTKSGSVSVCEALYMNLPLILDNVGITLAWEQFNIEFIKKRRFGSVVQKYDEVYVLLEKYLEKNIYGLQVKKSLELYHKKTFNIHIKELLTKWLQE